MRNRNKKWLILHAFFRLSLKSKKSEKNHEEVSENFREYLKPIYILSSTFPEILKVISSSLEDEIISYKEKTRLKTGLRKFKNYRVKQRCVRKVRSFGTKELSIIYKIWLNVAQRWLSHSMLDINYIKLIVSINVKLTYNSYEKLSISKFFAEMSEYGLKKILFTCGDVWTHPRWTHVA